MSTIVLWYIIVTTFLSLLLFVVWKKGDSLNVFVKVIFGVLSVIGGAIISSVFIQHGIKLF